MARKASLVDQMRAAAATVMPAPDATPATLDATQPTPADSHARAPIEARQNFSSLLRESPDSHARAPIEAPSKDMTTTAIHIPRDVHDLLRRVAVERAVRNQGGRPSVSAVLTELVRQHWDELEAEARR